MNTEIPTDDLIDFWGRPILDGRCSYQRAQCGEQLLIVMFNATRLARKGYLQSSSLY
jgi:hypothetical protein